jgi:hypothetical protein
MAYSIFTPTGSEHAGTPITVPDNAIDQGLYNASNKLGVQLVGRNAIDYGTAVAQNTVQMVSNFAGGLAPVAAKSLQGQLWFNATSPTAGSLYVRTATSTGGEFPAGWEKLVSVNSSQTGTIPIVNPAGGTEKDGDIQILTGPTRINMWAAGGWRSIFPAVYS